MDDRQFYYDAWNDSQCNCPGCDGLTTKLCIDAQFASSECGTEPPVFVCDKCANSVRAAFLLDIVQPIGEVAASCENKPCKGDDRTAKYTCFSETCIKKQRYETNLRGKFFSQETLVIVKIKRVIGDNMFYMTSFLFASFI